MNRITGKLLLVTLALCCGATGANAQVKADASTQGQQTSSADNSRINSRDAGATAQTPQAQSNAKGDRDTLAAVRKSIVQDKTLSTSAHNVKILVSGGIVTLRGPVKSEDEKTKIDALAKSTAGVTRVDNRIDIKTN